MFYLIACILCTSSLYLIFKGFEKYRVDLLQAIVINYIVAGLCGFLMAAYYGSNIHPGIIFSSDWSVFAMVIGLMFMINFSLMGISTQRAGVSVTSVANKMSVVLPVLFGFIFLNEIVTGNKIFGIVLALVALYFTTLRNSNDKRKVYLLYPLIIFIASGIIDIMLGYCSQKYINPENTLLFTATLFSVAALSGLCYLLVLMIAGKQKIERKNIIGGLVLGIPNFGSILFVFEGLKSTKWDVSVFYPVLNMGVVVVAAFSGWFFFREKLSVLNLVGIGLAILSIYLISI